MARDGSRRRWTEEEDERLIRMRAKGELTTERIASELGRTVSSVSSRIGILVNQGRLAPIEGIGRIGKKHIHRREPVFVEYDGEETYKPLGVTCKYPECHYTAVKRFALVPLCVHHNNVMRKETLDYYRGHFGFIRREEYHKIMGLIPWRNKYGGEPECSTT